MFDIGMAVKKMKEGYKVRRSGWNGKDMWIWIYQPEQSIWHEFPRLPFVNMKTADNCVIPWLCSQSDLLAKDWEVYGV